MSQEINDKIIELLHRRLQQRDLTAAEERELENWINASEDNREFYDSILNKELFDKAIKEFGEPDTEASLQKVKATIFATEDVDQVHIGSSNQLPWKRHIVRFAAAATIIPVLLISSYFLFFKKSSERVAAEEKPNQTVFANQIHHPGGDRALLTLSNGSAIYLDSAQNIGTLAITESAIKYGEKLYDIAKANNTAGEVKFNTLANPRGLKQISVLLPDKSKVWLSAFSELRFPRSFNGNERRIELKGDAYFEIAKDPARPFIVKVTSGTQESEVKVLGTHFNVTAYDDEEAITTTLLEGSVEVTNKDKQKATLIPGQQAVLVPGKGIAVASIDTGIYIDRKKGIFQFKDAPMKTIMKQVERMYNVKVVPEGKLPEEFTTTLYQNETIENLIKDLNDSDDLECTLNGSIVTVRQKSKSH